MATRRLTGLTLAILAVLAVFAGIVATVMGQSKGASFHIVNDGVESANGTVGVKVHCFDKNGPTDLPVTTLLPGQSLYFTWPLVSILEDIYKCDFEMYIPNLSMKASFEVWKQQQGNFGIFLNECKDCKWSIVTEGFNWYSDFDRKWISKYPWTLV